MAVDEALTKEPSPYLNPTAVSKGILESRSGGVTALKDTTNGTTLFTVDPDTGTVTIAGPIQASVTLNVGTINNTTIAGAGTNAGTINNLRLINNGTFNNGTFGTPAITGGTLTNSLVVTPTVNNPTIGTPAVSGGTVNSVLQSGGVEGTSGSVIYVKNLVPGDLGTINFLGGLITSFS